MEKYRRKERICITYDDLWAAKTLYDSAYHPDTGEKIFIFGRFCSQAFTNAFICAGMLTFYKKWRHIIFWQFFNQSYNALVNYSNKSGKNEMTNGQLLICYLSATTAACTTGVYFSYKTATVHPFLVRFMPFFSCSVANMINIRLMRSDQVENGIPVWDESGKEVGLSKNAGRMAIVQVVISRIMMSVPTLIVLPVILNWVEKTKVYRRRHWITFPLQISFGIMGDTFLTPFFCAIFKENSEISYGYLDEDIRSLVDGEKHPVLFYRKGL